VQPIGCAAAFLIKGAGRINKRVKNRRGRGSILALVAALLASLGIWGSVELGLWGGTAEPFAELTTASAFTAPCQVHFIDVGQADCTLILCEGEAMLIDAGNHGDAELIKEYLRAQGATTLRYVAGTHPHEDHIGSMDTVLGVFEVQELLLPDVEAGSSYYKNMMHAVDKRAVSVSYPQRGDSYSLGGGSFVILAPNENYGDDLNNWSIALKFTYGSDTFLFTGDAEMEAEYDISDNGLDLSAEVYQVGHHGSYTSTSQQLMKKVKPRYAVVSAGADNDYGHPAEEVLNRLAEYGAAVFRTDLQGTIVTQSEGNGLTWSRAPAESRPAVSEQGETCDYVFNKKTMKFHLPECQSVQKISQENYQEFHGTGEEALELGYSPCGNCKP